ncbi:MAG TPA: TlpA disulfide reductase family protein [Candidatus Eisenbacteria bacterium]|jgi:peroxiredoxin
MSSRNTIRSSKRATAARPVRSALSGLAAALLALLLASGCARQGSKQGNAKVPADAGAIGSKAPDFELADISGKTVRLSDFAGKVVLLDFWATWCPPCRDEVPDFVRLQAKYRQQGVQVVGLSLDAEGAKVVRPFAEEYNVNYTMLMANAETAAQFGGILGIPTTFVLDRQGRIVKKFIGRTELKTFEEAIKPLLET